MHANLLSLSLITGLMSATAFAEPAIQAGDSLDSLSKVKVSTTVNGQAGSIQDLVASGQIRSRARIQGAPNRLEPRARRAGTRSSAVPGDSGRILFLFRAFL